MTNHSDRRESARTREPIVKRMARWFATKMEPPVMASSKMKTMRIIKPGASPSVADAFARFLTYQSSKAWPLPKIYLRQLSSNQQMLVKGGFQPISARFCSQNRVEWEH